MLFITRITLDEQDELQKRTRLPGFSRTIEDAQQKQREAASVYPQHGYDDENSYWWAIDETGVKYHFVISEP